MGQIEKDSYRAILDRFTTETSILCPEPIGSSGPQTDIEIAPTLTTAPTFRRPWLLTRSRQQRPA
jgi:hypothetical protein